MTTEFVLILGLYAFILLGILFNVPKRTFDSSAPRLAAKIERDVSVGKRFNNKLEGRPTIQWMNPDPRNQAGDP